MIEPTAPSERRIPLFLYGSYLDPAVVARQGVALPRRAPCILYGFALLVDPIARIAERPGHRVFGALVQLAQDELDAMYATELMRPYRALPVTVQQADRSLVPALTYTPASAPRGLERPRAYVETLVRAGEELGFPADYLAEVARWGTAGD